MSVVKFNEIGAIVQREKALGKRVVATNGCFDILHVGHAKYLEQSKALGDLLIVGLNSDKSVRKLKGEGRPINPEEDRAELLAALKAVDYVVIFDEQDACAFLKEVKPNIYTKGGDYKPNSLPEYNTTQEIGAKIEIIDLVAGKSTTSIVSKISQ